ncbi:MAG: LTA synthase family protein, partial [Candidatus Marinimicrobia bacterium]|nr:LTA synthase family protein [Candidatus Neomarinimicrobiota bacterium]
ILPLRANLFSRRRTAFRAGGLMLGLYAAMALFQYFAETQTTLRRVNRYGLSETRLEIYLSNRLGSEDHLGSVLQFGFLWTYFSDWQRLGRRDTPLEDVPPEHYALSDDRALLRNIVVIEVEALDRTIIDFTWQGQPVTPFLNRLAGEYIFFDNVYAQHSAAGGTSDGDFCFLTSQYPLGYKGSFGAIGLEKLPSLPRILRSNDYATMVFHANYGSLYHRSEGSSRLGFEHLYFKSRFNIVDPDRWHTLKDREFLRQVFDIIASQDEPFFAHIITLSSHSPFDLLGPADYGDTFTLDSPLTQNYFNTMRYVDAALEMFVNNIMATYPEALILLYGDHTSNIRRPEYTATTDPQIQPIPLIMIDPLSPALARYTRPGTTVDLAPTLFDQLGFAAPAFWQGQSLMNPANPKAPV